MHCIARGQKPQKEMVQRFLLKAWYEKKNLSEAALQLYILVKYCMKNFNKA